VTDKGVSHIPDSWSPDGETLAFSAARSESSVLWLLSVRDKKATVFADGPESDFGRTVFRPTDDGWRISSAMRAFCES
jgi:Tol biopolymer transport system component